MSVVFLIIFIFISVAIVGLILLQEGKGGGLTGMSTGMDGVMGAKNPLRRWTAYLFVVFVVMCLTINMYFHNRDEVVLPTGLDLPSLPAPGAAASLPIIPEGALRPSNDATAAITDIVDQAITTAKQQDDAAASQDQNTDASQPGVTIPTPIPSEVNQTSPRATTPAIGGAGSVPAATASESAEGTTTDKGVSPTVATEDQPQENITPATEETTSPAVAPENAAARGVVGEDTAVRVELQEQIITEQTTAVAEGESQDQVEEAPVVEEESVITVEPQEEIVDEPVITPVAEPQDQGDVYVVEEENEVTIEPQEEVVDEPVTTPATEPQDQGDVYVVEEESVEVIESPAEVMIEPATMVIEPQTEETSTPVTEAASN